MTGFSWESLYNGRQFKQEPVRLLSVIAATRDSMDEVLSKQPAVAALLENHWMHWVAIEGNRVFRYVKEGSWETEHGFEDRP